jgi:dihydrofolate synthase/folylpolyglutamate synthase
MTYDQALARLAALGPELAAAGTRRKFTLDHIRALLRALGDPQQRFPSVLIAGTNGKGSTAATLASIAGAAGLRTGLYTSPHLLHVNERIQTGGPEGFQPIEDAEFASIFSRVDEAAKTLIEQGSLPHAPSFFELLTATAFAYFAEQHVELAILEVGLGGRLDATNVVDPLIAVITDIALDHMDYLGSTLPEIAREKAGILRPDGVLVTLSQHPLANQAIGEAAVALNVRGVDAARYLPPREISGGGREAFAHNAYPLSIEGEVVQIDSPLAGQHQQRNLALAVAAAVELRMNHGFAIPNVAIEKGVRQTRWPGRLELLTPSEPGIAPLLLDVAHNPAGAWALRAALAQLPEDRPRTLIFSCLRDKQLTELAQVLFPLFDSTSGDPMRAQDHILLAPIQNARAASLDDLLAAAHALDVPAHAAPHLPGALMQARRVTPPHGIIVAPGSVFLVGELRALALQEASA